MNFVNPQCPQCWTDSCAEDAIHLCHIPLPLAGVSSTQKDILNIILETCRKRFLFTRHSNICRKGHFHLAQNYSINSSKARAYSELSKSQEQAQVFKFPLSHIFTLETPSSSKVTHDAQDFCHWALVRSTCQILPGYPCRRKSQRAGWCSIGDAPPQSSPKPWMLWGSQSRAGPAVTHKENDEEGEIMHSHFQMSCK